MCEDATDATQQAVHNSYDAAHAGRIDYEKLLDRIKVPDRGGHKPIVILDGGLGTTLEDEYQVAFSSSKTPTWSSHLLIASPETLSKVHESFAEAGADIILTATYQAAFDGFLSTRRGHGDAFVKGRGSYYSQEEAEAIMRSAVPLARSAFGSRDSLVALSLGAYGATMIPSTEYTGRYPPEMGDIWALSTWHARRIIAFEGHQKTWDNIDLVAFETLPRVDEIQAVRRATQLLSRQKPFWISCVFPDDDEKLPDGSDVIDVVRAMLGEAPFGTDQPIYAPLPMGIGINCTKVSRLRSLISKFENAVDSMQMPLPHLMMYPDGANESVYDATSQKWIPQKDAATFPEWDEEVFDILQEVQQRDKWAGIIVGGCCKTRPQNIAQLKRRIDQKQ